MKYPFALTEANLKTAMTDPRYTNSRHPESQSWRDMVSQGFATLYPDGNLRGDHTDALPRFQDADGHIYASDGTKVASGRGRQSTVRTMEWRNGESYAGIWVTSPIRRRFEKRPRGSGHRQ
ncbi:hypothetical protein [Magnetospirillum molischianum]|uniref:Uncharacterized protein n=1 Tax=Magnetospirillum molischianum DSM 120 TaxID=1150626 RepID=H8FWT3_MAGML|nr:hypothetical protein [Magnetospirillum molischianum]CCG42821.1 hypothetical protein PHAMO_470072 [Magnetospirillum molischianum DSM 120]